MNINSAMRLNHLQPPASIINAQEHSARHMKNTAQSKVIDHQKYKAEPLQTENLLEHVSTECKDDFLELVCLILDASLGLLDIRRQYAEFNERLKDLRPDIASAGFGFTLDENSKIKILDSGKLGEADKSWLTEEINTFKDIKHHVYKHSKLLIQLVEKDTQRFGGRFNLNSENFQNTIDYGDILNKKWGSMGTSLDSFFTRQILENAEKRAAPLLDTYA
ncbi:hypothetical protein [Pseudomonas sp. Irchel 3A5]|uniref:hypothetical protein n=1 Tax=Pseudomonas sp. Irchel 3A5 TaxID=2008911 RepID=UPI000BA2EFC6|nr:hypothetical protein [Pseudomonas sp. Irchel 3A5]